MLVEMLFRQPVPEPLRRYTGFLLTRLGLGSAQRFAAALEPLGIHPKHFGAMNVIDAEPGITQHGLCGQAGIDPSSMVAVIDELERLGYAERRPHPDDRRARSIHLTSEGKAALRKGREVARRAQDQLLGPLEPAEREQLQELLLKLADAPREPA